MSIQREARAWATFKSHLRTGRLNIRRIENQMGNSMTDTLGINRNGAAFVMELKALADWPKRDSTFPLLDAFEPGQLPYMRSWIFWGGHALVLLRVKTTFYLLNPALKLDAMTKQQLINTALAAQTEPVLVYLESLKR